MTNPFKNKKIRTLSKITPKTLKPCSFEQFGYFLAGLIDSDGCITKRGEVRIAFHVNEIRVAYYLKAVIGYGTVYKEKHSLTVRYTCGALAGLVKIAPLIINKLKHDTKIDQFNTRLVPTLLKKGHFCPDTIDTPFNLLNNHWLAGFIQGDGSLTVLLSKRKRNNNYEVAMNISISQKKPKLLELIKEAFGGSIGYRKLQDGYYYTSNSFTNAVKLIQYLDRFQLIGNKLSQYWVWRQAYILFQEKAHLSPQGMAEIALFKKQLTFLKHKKF